MSYKSQNKINNFDSSNIIILGDKVYDISKFDHPGGDAIKMGAGRQAIELFWSYHPSYLTSMFDAHCNGMSTFFDDLYVGKVSQFRNINIDEYSNYHHPPSIPFIHNLSFYDRLKSEVNQELNNTKTNFELILKDCLIMLTWISMFISTYFYSESLLNSIIFSILLGFVNSMIGTCIMHDANHYSMFLEKKSKLSFNKACAFIFDLLGGSSYVWKNIHNIGHHPYTNIDGKDPDISTKEPHFRRIKSSQTFFWWYRYQCYYLPILYGLLLPQMLIRDFIAVINREWGCINFQPLNCQELALFIIGKSCWIYYRIYLPIMYGIFWYLMFVEYFITSLILVILFQINHVVSKTQFFNNDNLNFDKYKKAVDFHFSKDHWMYQQIVQSCNFSPGSWFWNHITGGLNHQIEHHLFPSVNHVHYPKIAPIVQKFCQENNIPYNYHDSIWNAIKDHFQVLNSMS